MGRKPLIHQDYVTQIKDLTITVIGEYQGIHTKISQVEILDEW
jgi:hypothetical protein